MTARELAAYAALFALAANASRLVAILAGGSALAVLFWLYMLACDCGLAGGV